MEKDFASQAHIFVSESGNSVIADLSTLSPLSELHNRRPVNALIIRGGGEYLALQQYCKRQEISVENSKDTDYATRASNNEQIVELVRDFGEGSLPNLESEMHKYGFAEVHVRNIS
jgi:hypothetical protein